MTLVAAALRLLDLTGRSMWLDEGASLLRISGSWVDMLRGIIPVNDYITIDTHPPLYYVALKAWTGVTGSNEFALKFLTAILGLLAVPLVYVLARRLYGQRVGLIAAAIVSFSGALIWYASEIRSYAILVAMVTLSSYVLVRFCDAPRLEMRRLAAWALACLALVLTHYSSVVVIFGQALLLFTVFVRRRRELGPWRLILPALIVTIGVAVAAAVTLSPAVRAALGRMMSSGTERDFAFVPINEMARAIISGLVFGIAWQDPTGGILFAVLGITTLIGLLWPRSRSESNREPALNWIATLGAILSLVLWFALSLFKSNFQAIRHLIVVVPFVAIGLARGINVVASAQWIRQRLGLAWQTALVGALVAALLLAQTIGVARQFARGPAFDDDWRGLAKYVQQKWEPGDVVLLNDAIISAIIGYYAPELERRSSNESTPTSIREAIADGGYPFDRMHARLWYVNVYASDKPEQQAVLDWMDAHFVRLEDKRFVSRSTIVQVILFANPRFATNTLPPDATPVRASMGAPELPIVAGFQLGPGNMNEAEPNVRLSIYWQYSSQTSGVWPGPISVAVRLESAGQVWSSILQAARLPDTNPGDNGILRRDYFLPLPLALPPDDFKLIIETRVGEKEEVARREAIAVPADTADALLRLSKWHGRIVTDGELWTSDGATLASAETPSTLLPGKFLPLALTWMRNNATERPLRLEVALKGVLGETVAWAPVVVDRGATRSRWTQGSPLRTLVSLPIPPDTQPGTYWLFVSAAPDADIRAISSGPAVVATVEIVSYPRSPVPPAGRWGVEARVGELSLLGLDGPAELKRGTTIEFHTLWRVDESPARDGVLFLHLRAPDGRIIAQDDNPPENGQRSSRTYRPGEGMDQTHRLLIPTWLPEGEYTLLAGVYSPGDLARWDARQAGAPARDNLISIGTITLPPITGLSQRSFLPIAQSGFDPVRP